MQHEALVSAQQEIRNKAEEEEDASTSSAATTELADFDESALETGNWD